MKIINTTLYLYIVFLFLSGCQYGTINKEEIQGEWYEQKEQEVIHLGGISNLIYFTNDSFYLHLLHFSDQGVDSCKGESYSEYIRGIYFLKKRTIRLIGMYTDKSYKNILTNSCHSFGKYDQSFFYYYDELNMILNTKTVDFSFVENNMNFYKIRLRKK
jgi:hypothetical protein